MPSEAELEEPRAAVAIVRTRAADPEFLILQRVICAEDPWSGHLALPGGMREGCDADLVETCVRETLEECGLALGRDQLRGQAPTKLAGRQVGHPMPVAVYIFEIPRATELRLQTTEMSGGWWVPLSHLIDPANHERAPMVGDRPDVLYPCIRIAGTRLLWGFTYQVLTAHLADWDG